MVISQNCSPAVSGYPRAADLGALLGTFQRDLLLLRSAKKFQGEKKPFYMASKLQRFWICFLVAGLSPAVLVRMSCLAAPGSPAPSSLVRVAAVTAAPAAGACQSSGVVPDSHIQTVLAGGVRL